MPDTLVVDSGMLDADVHDTSAADSGTNDTGTADAGADTATPDSGTADSGADTATPDSGTNDTGTADAADSGGDSCAPPPGFAVNCVMLTGSGPSQVCQSEHSRDPSTLMCNDPGYAPGSCPTAGLVGCCVTANNGGVSTGPMVPGVATTASCVYSAANAATLKPVCIGLGEFHNWQTTPPGASTGDTSCCQLTACCAQLMSVNQPACNSIASAGDPKGCEMSLAADLLVGACH